jgi:hypothetical protein
VPEVTFTGVLSQRLLAGRSLEVLFEGHGFMVFRLMQLGLVELTVQPRGVLGDQRGPLGDCGVYPVRFVRVDELECAALIVDQFLQERAYLFKHGIGHDAFQTLQPPRYFFHFVFGLKGPTDQHLQRVLIEDGGAEVEYLQIDFHGVDVLGYSG